MAVTTNPVRPPLGMPPGSVRGLLSLQTAITFWMLLLIPTGPKIPLHLYFLLTLVMIFFVAHGKSIARRGEGPSPLWLPGGSIRFLLVAGTLATFAYVIFNDAVRLERLTPEGEDITRNWRYYVSALGIGFVLGYGTRILPFRNTWSFQAFQAWTAILAMAVLFLEFVLQLLNVGLVVPREFVAWETVVVGTTAFYFGSRS